MQHGGAPKSRRKIGAFGYAVEIPQVSWRDLFAAFGPVIVLVVLGIWLAVYLVRPAPPKTLRITAGVPGSSFTTYADKYKAILARNGVTLEVLPSQGALDNLHRLRDPQFNVDIGFVQGGLIVDGDTGDLMSLGSIAYAPLAVYYRGAHTIERLSQFKGKRVTIGREGSGTHFLIKQLLNANGVENKAPTQLLNMNGEEAAAALLAHKVDAVMLMGDAASPAIMRKLTHTPGIRLMNFSQAEAYARRYRFLSKIELPMGSIDFAKNMPTSTLDLIAPYVEVVARSDLHPALSDLLIDAMREVHGRATLIQKAGEFPAPLEHEYPISDDASRYYKSGKSFLYRHLPFWLASLADRMLVVVVPLIVLLIPGLRMVPSIYRWRISRRIYGHYGELIALERDMRTKLTPEQRTQVAHRLDEIEKRVNVSKMPLPFADQFYVLREHINFVRRRLAAHDGEAQG